jgi:hypothetical protein
MNTGNLEKASLEEKVFEDWSQCCMSQRRARAGGERGLERIPPSALRRILLAP